VKVARIFNTYGPRMRPDDGRVISNFIVQALANAPVTIYGDGRQTRSFCFVSDLIEAMTRFMQTPEGVCGPMNLGNPEEMSILEIAREIIRLSGSRSRIEYRHLPSDDPRQRRPDISIARAALDWTPSVPLAEGLRLTIDYFDRLLCRTVSV